MTVHKNCPLCASARITRYGSFVNHYNGQQFDLELSACRQCAFVFLNNYDFNLQDFYDEEYIDLEGFNNPKLPSEQLSVAARLLKIRSMYGSAQPRLLDYGIGDGYFLHLATQHEFDAYGFDISAASLDSAARKYGIARDHLSGAEPLTTYGAASFDVVHSCEVIEHLEYPGQLLELAHKLLKPGGLLVVQTGNINSLAARMMGSRWTYLRPVHISYFNKKNLTGLVEQHGFRIVYNRTTDVDLKTAARVAKALAGEKGLGESLGFSFYWATCQIPQFRRSTLIYARKEQAGA